jgi:hypothetical protein
MEAQKKKKNPRKTGFRGMRRSGSSRIVPVCLGPNCKPSSKGERRRRKGMIRLRGGRVNGRTEIVVSERIREWPVKEVRSGHLSGALSCSFFFKK